MAFKRPELVAQETSEMHHAWWLSLAIFAGWFICPALAILAFGFALLWALRGFHV
jgi:hypothetical protein